jgi:2-polyprenyl-6-methoxyphenol hydroxylase-like FAD-dependent oxidoreductase
VGDAAHVTHPNGGQGMNMAIQDAEALARHLAPALTQDAAAQERALAAYEAERRPRNARALARADAGTRFERPTPWAYGLALSGLAFSSAFPFIIRRYAHRLTQVGG